MSDSEVINIFVRDETPAERRQFLQDEKRLNSHIGQLVRLWALLHDNFANIFHYTIANSDEISFRPSVGHAIWHSIKSDLLQRQIMQAALQAKIDLNQRYNWPDDRKTQTRIMQEYIWLLKETTKKSDARNDLVHAPIVFFLDYLAAEHEASISDMSSDPRSEKLKGKDIYQYCAYCIDFCQNANSYLHKLTHYHDETKPFPERPKFLPLSHFPTRRQRAKPKPRRKGFRVINPLADIGS